MKRALFFALACASCASTEGRVDPALINAFPSEGRRWTYEAENEVIIALDRLDAAKGERDRAEVKIAEAERLIRAAKKRDKGVAAVDARRAYFTTRRDEKEAGVRAAEVGVECARASLELTKAKLVIKFDLPHEETFLAPFEAGYEKCARRLEDAKREAEKLAAEAVRARESWRKARAEFAQQSGDHDHGLWIE